MRIEEVRAEAFGSLRRKRLPLAPGMTVVWGPNEAGKSTWHAALYAGLCGRRRGRGSATREDQAFERSWRPWDDERWAAGTIVTLADGRRIEPRHDLGGRVACQAVDLMTGVDVSSEIMFEGAPDGSRWLDLNRRLFPAVACVRQSDVLGVRQSAGALQEHLQRATATGGADETAAGALRRIDEYRRVYVGADQANAIGPLRQAQRALAEAREQLHEARAAHDEYAALLANLDQCAAEERSAWLALEAAEEGLQHADEEPPDPVYEVRVEAARRNVAALTEASALTVPLAGAGLAALLAAAAATLGFVPIGVALVFVAAGLVVWGVWRRRASRLGPAIEALRAAEEDLASAREARLRASHERHTEALRACEAAGRLAAELRGQAAARAASLTSVAEAEEALASAEAELARVRGLARTLDLTRQLLEKAQAQVHHEVAPWLAAQIAQRLPATTSGRYDEVLLDPHTLDVRVRAAGGRWREAALLSQGTAEQVYLLLRVALAEHLTRPGESCPLILDDPTPNFDRERTVAMLELLHALSAERQIVLFSHSLDVLAWADARLDDPLHRVARLPSPVRT